MHISRAKTGTRFSLRWNMWNIRPNKFVIAGLRSSVSPLMGSTRSNSECDSPPARKSCQI
uniref:Uncharacterized protein n=1 Tax=Arion vulgaris TaxID=1028688 RepID=A0A0B7A6F4_9EUPU